MNTSAVRYVLLFALLLAACVASSMDGSTLRLRGPLVPLVERMPESLAACDSVHREYARPFWRAPYRECRTETADSREVLEVDSDSVLTQVYATWTIALATRDREFARHVAALDRAFGPGRHCAPRKVEWRRGDSLHAVVLVTPLGDVGDLERAPTWRITRLMRLGPLDPTTWGCRIVAPAS